MLCDFFATGKMAVQWQAAQPGRISVNYYSYQSYYIVMFTLKDREDSDTQ